MGVFLQINPIILCAEKIKPPAARVVIEQREPFYIHEWLLKGNKGKHTPPPGAQKAPDKFSGYQL